MHIQRGLTTGISFPTQHSTPHNFPTGNYVKPCSLLLTGWHKNVTRCHGTFSGSGELVTPWSILAFSCIFFLSFLTVRSLPDWYSDWRERVNKRNKTPQECQLSMRSLETWLKAALLSPKNGYCCIMTLNMDGNFIPKLGGGIKSVKSCIGILHSFIYNKF